MFNTRNLIIGGVVFVAVILSAILWPQGHKTKAGIAAVSSQEAVAMQTPPQTKTAPKAEDATAPKTAAEASADELFQKAKASEVNQDWLQAKNYYHQIYTQYPDYDNIEEVQKRLESVNMRIIFSNTPTKQSVIHEVVKGDTLGALAKKYDTTVDLIKINNHLKNDVIRIGQRLRIWNQPFKIYVDKSQNKLTLESGGEVVKVYDVSTGENGSTPVGDFKITSKLRNPVWFNKGIVVPPESPANVLGSRWLGFDIPGYGIHGTVEPQNIGKAVTAGCVRMRNADVEELYSLIPMGTKVTITN